jgi:hypothetical protein
MRWERTMLRITRVSSDDSGATLKVEGKLVGPWVDELLHVCEECLSTGSCPQLDLSSITFIDPVGLELVERLLAQGFGLIACSGLVAEFLNRENR